MNNFRSDFWTDTIRIKKFHNVFHGSQDSYKVGMDYPTRWSWSWSWVNGGLQSLQSLQSLQFEMKKPTFFANAFPSTCDSFACIFENELFWNDTSVICCFFCVREITSAFVRRHININVETQRLKVHIFKNHLTYICY